MPSIVVSPVNATRGTLSISNISVGGSRDRSFPISALDSERNSAFSDIFCSHNTYPFDGTRCAVGHAVTYLHEEPNLDSTPPGQSAENRIPLPEPFNNTCTWDRAASSYNYYSHRRPDARTHATSTAPASNVCFDIHTRVFPYQITRRKRPNSRRQRRVCQRPIRVQDLLHGRHHSRRDIVRRRSQTG